MQRLKSIIEMQTDYDKICLSLTKKGEIVMRSVSIEKNQVVRLLLALLACGVLFLIIHFTTAFADEKDYIIKLSGSTVYTGDQITPQVTSVMYGNEIITDFTVTYGENIRFPVS